AVAMAGLPTSLDLRLERRKQGEDQDDRYQSGRQEQRGRDRRHGHDARRREIRREKRNRHGQDRGDRQADQSPKERQLDLPLLGGRDRREEERGESFGEDSKFHLRD